MSRFKFSLQQVLELKQSLKKQLATEIIKLELEEEKVQNRIKKLTQEWENEGRALEAEKSSLVAAEYRLRMSYLEYLSEKIEEERKALFDIARLLATKRQKLIQFSREQKILEKLRERREQEFRKQERRREQKEIDEVAAQLTGYSKDDQSER